MSLYFSACSKEEALFFFGRCYAVLLLAICCWWHLSSQVAGLHRPATVRCPHLPSGAVRPHSQLQGNAYRVSLIMSSWSLQGKLVCCSGEIIWAAHEAFIWSGPPCHYCLVGMNWCLVKYQPTTQLESHSYPNDTDFVSYFCFLFM